MKIYKLGFIGAGNMAQAIIKGVREAMSDTDIAAASPDETHQEAVRATGSMAVSDNGYVAANSRYLVLAVKPQVAPEVLAEIAPYVDSGTTVISIMAGVTIDTIAESLPNVRTVVRTMPNMAAFVGKAATGIAYRNADDEVKSYVNRVFGSVGKYAEVDESLLSAVTALSGSGTAYVYYFMRAMIEGACQLGLDEVAARDLALQTFAGAADMAAKSDKDLGEMIDAVCSKGGTTIQAINSFDSNNVDGLIKQGVKAAYIRAVELSEAGR